MASKKEVRRIPAQQASLHPLHQPLPKVDSERPLSGSCTQVDKEEGGDPFAKLLKFPTEFIEKKQREEFKKKDLIHVLSNNTGQSLFIKEDARSNHPLLRPSSSVPVPAVSSPSPSPYSFPQLVSNAISSQQLRPAASVLSTDASAPSTGLPFSSPSHCSSLSQPLSSFHSYTSGCPPVSGSPHSDQQPLSPSPRCAGSSVLCPSSTWSSPSFSLPPCTSSSFPVCLTTPTPSKPSPFPCASSPHYSSYPALPPPPLPNFTSSSSSSSSSAYTSTHASPSTDKAPVPLPSRVVRTKEAQPQVSQTAQEEKKSDKLDLDHSRIFLDLDISAFLPPTNKASSRGMCDDHGEKLLGKEQPARQPSFGGAVLTERTVNQNTKRIPRQGGSTEESVSESVGTRKQNDSLSQVPTRASFDDPFVAGSFSPFAERSLERESSVGSFLHGEISSSTKDVVAEREEGKQHTSSFWPGGSAEEEDERGEEEAKTKGRTGTDCSQSDEKGRTKGMCHSSKGSGPAAVDSCFSTWGKEAEKCLDKNTAELSPQTPFFFPVDWDSPPAFPSSSSSCQVRSSSYSSSLSSSSSSADEKCFSSGAIASEISSVSSSSSSSVWMSTSSSYASPSTLPSSNSSSSSSALQSTSSFSMLSKPSSTFPSSVFPSSFPLSGNLLSSSSCSVHPLGSTRPSQEGLPFSTGNVSQPSEERVDGKKNTCQVLHYRDELSLFGLPSSHTESSYLGKDSNVLVGSQQPQLGGKEEDANDEKEDGEQQRTPSDTNLRSFSNSPDTISHPLLVFSEEREDEGPKEKKERPRKMRLFDDNQCKEQALHLFPEKPSCPGVSSKATQNCGDAKAPERNSHTTKTDVWTAGRTTQQNGTEEEKGNRQRKEKGKEDNVIRSGQPRTAECRQLDLPSLAFSLSSCQDRACSSSSLRVTNCCKEAPVSFDTGPVQNGHIRCAFVDVLKKREDEISPLESPETGEHVWNEEKETRRRAEGESRTEEKDNRRVCRQSEGQRAEEKKDRQQPTLSSSAPSSFLFPADALGSLKGEPKKEIPRGSSPCLATVAGNDSREKKSVETNEDKTFFFLTSTPPRSAEERKEETNQSQQKTARAAAYEQNTSRQETIEDFTEAAFECKWEMKSDEDGQHAPAKKQGKERRGEADNPIKERKSSLFLVEAPEFLHFSSASPLREVEGKRKEEEAHKEGMRQDEEAEEKKQLSSELSRSVRDAERGGRGDRRDTKNEESLRNIGDGGEAESKREREQENQGSSVDTFPPHSLMAAPSDNRFACLFDVFESDKNSAICSLASPSSSPPASSSPPPRPSSSPPSSCLASPFPAAAAPPPSLGTCCAFSAEEKGEVASSSPFFPQTSFPGQKNNRTAEELSKKLFAFFEQDDSQVVPAPLAIGEEDRGTSVSSRKQTLSSMAYSSFSPPGAPWSLLPQSSNLKSRSSLLDETPNTSCSNQKKKTDLIATSSSSPSDSLPFPSLLPPPPPAPPHCLSQSFSSSFPPSSSPEEKNLLFSGNFSSASPCTPPRPNVSPSSVSPPSCSVSSLPPQGNLLTSPRESSARSPLSGLSSDAAKALAALVSADAAFERLKLRLGEEEESGEDKNKEGGAPVQESVFDAFFSTPRNNKATLSSSLDEENLLFPSLQLNASKDGEKEEAAISDNRKATSEACLSTSSGRKEKKKKTGQHKESERVLKDSFPFSEWSSSLSPVSGTHAKEWKPENALCLSPSRYLPPEDEEAKETELKLASQSLQRTEAIIPSNRDPGNVWEDTTRVTDFENHLTSFCSARNHQQKTSPGDKGGINEAPLHTAISHTQRISPEDVNRPQGEKEVSQDVCTPDSSKALSDTDESERFPPSHSTPSSCMKREILGAEEAMVAALAIEIASPEMVLASSSEEIERVVKKQERSAWERGDDDKDDEEKHSRALTSVQTRREEGLKASSETSYCGARPLSENSDWRSSDQKNRSGDTQVICEREDNRQRVEREEESNVTKEDLEDIFETCVCRPAERHTSSFLPRPEEAILDEILTHQGEENKEREEERLVSSSPLLPSENLLNFCTSADTSHGLSSFQEPGASSYVRGTPKASFPETETRRDKDVHSFENHIEENHRVWREEDTPDCWIHMRAETTRRRETLNEGEATRKQDDALIHITSGETKHSFHMKKSAEQFLREVDDSKEEEGDDARWTDTKDESAVSLNAKTAKTEERFFVRKRDAEVGGNQRSKYTRGSPLGSIKEKEGGNPLWISSFSVPSEKSEEAKQRHTEGETEVSEREENLSWAIFPPSPPFDAPPLEEKENRLTASQEKQKGDSVRGEGAKDVFLRNEATGDENLGLLSFQGTKSSTKGDASPGGLHDTPSEPSEEKTKENVCTRLDPSVEWRESRARHERRAKEEVDEERKEDVVCQDDEGKTTGDVGKTAIEQEKSNDALKTGENKDLLTAGETLKTEEQNKDIVLSVKEKKDKDGFFMDFTELGEWESASSFQQCKEQEEVREKKEARSCCEIPYSITEGDKSKESESETQLEKSERQDDSGRSFWPEENLVGKRLKEKNRNEIIWPREIDVNPSPILEDCWIEPFPQEEYKETNTLAEKAKTENNTSSKEVWDFSSSLHSGTRERKTPFTPLSGVCTPEGGLKDTGITADDPFNEGSGGTHSSPFSETPPGFFEVTFSSSLSSSPIQYSGGDKQLVAGKDHVTGVHTRHQNRCGFDLRCLPTPGDSPLYPTSAFSSPWLVEENLSENTDSRSLGKLTPELLEAERNERGAEYRTQAEKISSSDKVSMRTNSPISKWNDRPESKEREEENRTGSVGRVFGGSRAREKGEGEEGTTSGAWLWREEDRRKEEETDKDRKYQAGECIQNRRDVVEQQVCQVSRDDKKTAEDSYEEKKETSTRDLQEDEKSSSCLAVPAEKTESIDNQGDEGEKKDYYDTLSKTSSTSRSPPLLLLGPPSPPPSIALGSCLSSSLPSISSAFLCANSSAKAPASSDLLCSSHPSSTLASDLSSPASAFIPPISTSPAVASRSPLLHSKQEVDPDRSQVSLHGENYPKQSVHSTVPASSETSRICSSTFSSSLVSSHSSPSLLFRSPTEAATPTRVPAEATESVGDLSCLLFANETLCQAEHVPIFSEKKRDLKETKCGNNHVTAPDTTASPTRMIHLSLSSEAKHNPLLFPHPPHETTDARRRIRERENTSATAMLPAGESSSPFLLVRGVDESRDTVGMQPFDRQGEREKRKDEQVLVERRTSSCVELAEKKSEKERENELSSSSSSLLPLCPPSPPTTSVVSPHCHGVDERGGVASRKNEERRGREFLSSPTPLVRSSPKDGPRVSTRKEEKDVSSAKALSTDNSLFVSSFSSSCGVSISSLSPPSSLETRDNPSAKHDEEDDAPLQEPPRAERNGGEEKLGSTAGGTPGDLCQPPVLLQTDDTGTTLRNLSSGEDQAMEKANDPSEEILFFKFPSASSSFSSSCLASCPPGPVDNGGIQEEERTSTLDDQLSTKPAAEVELCTRKRSQPLLSSFSSSLFAGNSSSFTKCGDRQLNNTPIITKAPADQACLPLFRLAHKSETEEDKKTNVLEPFSLIRVAKVLREDGEKTTSLPCCRAKESQETGGRGKALALHSHDTRQDCIARQSLIEGEETEGRKDAPPLIVENSEDKVETPCLKGAIEEEKERKRDNSAAGGGAGGEAEMMATSISSQGKRTETETEDDGSWLMIEKENSGRYSNCF